MASVIESLKRQAERIFLGRGSVVGIGVAGDEEEPELVFLLSEESKETTKSVLTWASRNHIAVRFVVTGRIKALTKA